MTLVTTGAELGRFRVPGGFARRGDAVLAVEGPGAEACLQGILTCDIVKDAPAMRWGAVLTPKGMIITDLWVLRDGTRFLLVVPTAGVEALRSVLARSFPPRLAKVTDLSDRTAAWWGFGDTGFGGGALEFRPAVPAPFDTLVIAPREAAPDGGELPHEAADVVALLAGWPVRGREIDDRTLPQEVRFDELRGVDYDKGCYVGQETVARLHFRGHANRTLRAAVGTGAPPDDPAIMAGGREVAAVATLATVDDHWVASARIRREVETGDAVRVGERVARVQEFPVTIA
jgi:folate-binding protein YgfZ